MTDWPKPEIRTTDLMNLKQQVDESHADFIDRFIKK